jgi:hypothetical protein
MAEKQTTKRFFLQTVIDGRIVAATVSFSPAPAPGILTELARLDAERLVRQCVREDIGSGHL